MRQFKLPIHLIVGTDDLRPAMQNVYFKDGYMYATDSHLAIRASIKEFTAFGKEETKLLENKFLSKEIFEKVYKGKSSFNITEQGFEDDTTVYKFAKEPKSKFPNLENIFETAFKKRRENKPGETNGVYKMGMNTEFIAKIGKAMRTKSYQTIVFDFIDNQSPVIILNENHVFSELVGLLTPIMLSK